MTAPRASLLQWGCGRWGANVLRDLLDLGAEVTVVAKDRATAARAADIGAQRCIGVDEVADEHPPDGVVVVTPASHHAEAIRASAGFGCPIFCEKPLTQDVVSSAALVDEVGERLFVMHKWRWHPGIEALARLVDEGALGTPVALTATRLGLDLPQDDVDAVDTLLPHDLSIAVGVLGAIPGAVIGAVGEPWPGRPGWWLGGHVLLQDPGGPSLALHFSGATASRLRRVELVGTEGAAVLPSPDAARLELVVGDERRDVGLPSVLPLAAELRDFVEHCVGGPPPRASAAEGLAVVQSLATIRGALDDAGR